jgi:tetratricopeptide (TPR) repeat protein
LLVALLAVTALGSAACSQDPEARKQESLERGEKYLKDHKVNESIIELRKALQVDPDFAPALRALGRAYAEKAWYVDAWRELTRAQKIMPESLPLAIDLANVLLELGDWNEAEKQAALIEAQEPQNPRAVTIRAGALLGRGRLDEALAVIKIAPTGNRPEAERIRGEVLLRAGKLDEAEATYQAVLATQPNDLKTLIGLGAVNLRRQKFEEAAKFYEQAKASHPESPRALVGLAAIMAEQGRIGDAVKLLEQIDLRAQSIETILALGHYYVQANRPRDAARLLSPMVDRFPRVRDARYLLATALLLSGDATAVPQFEELDRQVPNNPLIRLRLASAYTQQGRPREALLLLDTIAAQSKKLSEYHLERGRALLLLGRLDEAFSAGSAAQRLAPRTPQPYMLLGHILALRGDSKGAQEKFAKAAEVDPAFVPAHLTAGQLHLAAKDPGSALKDFEAAVGADPTSLAAATAKAMALAQQNRLKEAIQFVEEALRSGPRDTGFYSLLGGLYAADGQKGKASAAFARALEGDPKNLSARLGLASVLMADGKDEEAIAHLQAAVKDRPDNLTAVFLLRSLYDRLGRPHQSISVLEAAVKANPQQTLFVLTLSDLYVSVGRYEDALGRTSELIGAQPDLAVARLIRGRAYLGKGDARAALRDFQEAVRASPKSAAAYFDLAQAYLVLGRKPESEGAYREAIKLEPRFDLAKRSLAALRGETPDDRGDLQEIDQLRALISADPRNVPAREALARAYLRRRQMPEAEAELRQMLTLAPVLAEPNVLLAQILLSQRKEEEAATYLAAALRSNPSHVSSNILLGGYLARKGQREQAIRLLETALSVNPNVPDAKFLLASLYAESRRLPEALTLARDLQRAEPKSLRPWLLTGALLIDQQNPRGAIDAFEKALTIDANSVDAHRGLGQGYERLGQIERAEQSYRRALAIKDNDVISLNNLAWILSEVKKKPDDALPFAMKAQQAAPKLASVIDTLGWIHYRRQAYGEAEKFLTQAVERAPTDAGVRFHLGMVYAKLGRAQDAVSALRRAAQLDPKLADRENISQLIKDLGS